MLHNRLHLRLTSAFASVPEMAARVRVFCSRAMHARAVAEVELCVVEAVNNAIEHACGGRSDESIDVDLLLSDGSVSIAISERGKGMPAGMLERARKVRDPNPANVDALPERGRGLEIIRQVMNEVIYEQKDGLNTLRLVRNLPSSGGERRVNDIDDFSSASLERAFRWHCLQSIGKRPDDIRPEDALRALSLAIRERLVCAMLSTEDLYRSRDPKRVYYLSMEFLMGRTLENNLQNLGILSEVRRTFSEAGLPDLEDLLGLERDAALGNGGLGRLAACFLDSIASLGIAGYGYGINYEYGLFRQDIDNGEQREQPDHWSNAESPWLIARPDEVCVVPVYGRIEHCDDREGGYNPMWMDWKVILGVPSDMPIVGHGGRTVNVLRLYSARASDEFDMRIFNEGDYLKAVEQKLNSETISKVLYPADSFPAGRELRLLQEYFLVACSVRDVVRRYKLSHSSMAQFGDKVAIQLNDTHPALTVAELMRLLVDEERLCWEDAWSATQSVLAYTNHTLLPEALEVWPVTLMDRVLPRHLQIIYEINRRFLDEVGAKWPGDDARARRMSIISEDGEKHVRMAHLCIVGGHSTNGVAALHTELVKTALVPDFYALWPERFNNKTNGVTQRRWLQHCNPRLAHLLDRAIGPEWVSDLDRLRGLEAHAGDAAFQADFSDVKRRNKEDLARLVRDAAGVMIDPTSLFDVQIKRIHEYKRQLLNVMHVIHRYLCIIEDGASLPPRTVLFAGKAAPGYFLAKRIIKLINDVAATVNDDPRVRGQLKVVFVPNYRVTLAERMVPGSDLSEQISTAGKEASGTGNMKLSMNGALTIGTLDGANVEIRDEVGADNFFLFGLEAMEIDAQRRSGSYDPWQYYHRDPNIRRVMDAIGGDRFCPHQRGHFKPLFERIMSQGDEYFHLADFDGYVSAQTAVDSLFARRSEWTRSAILNVARMGRFSSDRTVQEYARDIWHVSPVRSAT